MTLIERLRADADGWGAFTYEMGQATAKLEREAADALEQAAKREAELSAENADWEQKVIAAAARELAHYRRIAELERENERLRNPTVATP